VEMVEIMKITKIMDNLENTDKNMDKDICGKMKSGNSGNNGHNEQVGNKFVISGLWMFKCVINGCVGNELG
jgi:hypothetical protein